MNTSNEKQLNILLDRHNECQELLQQEYIAWRIDAKTAWNIKASLHNILENIPKKAFEELRKELYDLLNIINM